MLVGYINACAGLKKKSIISLANRRLKTGNTTVNNLSGLDVKRLDNIPHPNSLNRLR
jgi:hypothetical protein